MVTLNLEATNTEQEKIKRYLEENASNTLAEKINNGVKIAKDGKTLISKKNLTTFMQYAEEEVLKLIAESERKGRQVRCIDDSTVFGWAIHYFEEDIIEGKLYNEDPLKRRPYQLQNLRLPLLPLPILPRNLRPNRNSIFSICCQTAQNRKPKPSLQQKFINC